MFIEVFSPLVGLVLILLTYKRLLMRIRNSIRIDSISVKIIRVSVVKIFFGSVLLTAFVMSFSMLRLGNSSYFDGLVNFGGINLFDISTSKDVVLVDGLFVEHFGDSLEVGVYNVREQFERRPSFRLIEHLGSDEDVGGESLEPNHNFVNHLSGFFVREFFE